MKKIILAALLYVSVSSLAQPITDTNQLRSFINSAIVPNNTRAITATIVNRAFNGVLNSYAPIFQRFVDTLYFTGNTMYWRQRGITYSRPVGAGVPLNRVLTINGVSYDLSADRTWTIASSSSWGSISGTLSSQTDLQSALNAKADLSHGHTLSNISNFPSVSGMGGRVLTTDGNVVTWGVVPSHTHLLSNISNFPSVSGQGGKFLTTDGNVVTWGTPGGGVSLLAAIGSSPNANGASVSGSTLTLQPANETYGGVLTTGTQQIEGSKYFRAQLFINGGATNYGSLRGGGSYFEVESATGRTLELNRSNTATVNIRGGAASFSASGNSFGASGFIGNVNLASGAALWLDFPSASAGRFKINTNGQTYLNDMGGAPPSLGTNTVFKVHSKTRSSMPFPVMTQTERLAITSPEVGSMVYQTDGTEGVYIYKSTGWQFAY